MARRLTARELGVPPLGPNPAPTTAAVRRSMQGNRRAGTGPEMQLRRRLWAAGLRGYRVHRKDLPGRPDVAYTKWRVAIFVHGCFWHRCPLCDLPLPKTNTDFWARKFARNAERDARKKRQLEDAGWDVIVVWECQMRRQPEACVEAIRALLTARRRPDRER